MADSGKLVVLFRAKKDPVDKYDEVALHYQSVANGVYPLGNKRRWWLRYSVHSCPVIQ